MNPAAILTPFRHRWIRLSGRERVLIGLAALVLAAYGLSLAARPLLDARAEARSRIATYERMQARLVTLGDNAPVAVASSPDEPVAAIVTDTVTGYGLVIRRIETDQTATRVELEDAGFAEIVLWIEELERQHGLRVVGVEMERRSAGTVGARLAVQR